MKDRTRNTRRVGAVAPDPRPFLDCPECGESVFPADIFDPDLERYGVGWRWQETDPKKCPGCGDLIAVRVTDDYEEDARVYVEVVECEA